MTNLPYAHTRPPLQVFEEVCMWLSFGLSERGQKKPKTRKAMPRTPETQPLPPSPPNSHDKETNKEAGEGAYLSITYYRGSPFLAGGTDAKSIKSISEGNTAYLFWQEERMPKVLNPFPKEIPLVLLFINLIKKK